MTKRNLLVLVCVMLIAVLTLVSCGGKDNNDPEHEHTYNTSVYVSDATHHWHGASCEHTDLKVQVEAHADTNKDGVCDKCEYVTCTHEYADEWTSDEDNHWHASTCECEVISDKAAHTDSNKDGKCDTCEYVTCTHTFAENYSSDENGHWLAYTCDCELEPTVEEHADTDKNGICDTCSYVTCEHNPESAWTSDFDSHWHATDCGCDVKVDEGAHVDEDADTQCDICSYVCEHPEKEEWSSDENGHWHEPRCDHEFTPNVVPHEDLNKDGACDVCGYEDPSHEHTFVVGYNKDHHYLVSSCEHIIAKDFALHADENADNVCDSCNAFVGSITELVESSTSDEAFSKVSGAIIYSDPEDSYYDSKYTVYKDFLLLEQWDTPYYISSYVDDTGATQFIKVYVDTYSGVASLDQYAEGLSLKGAKIGVMYDAISGNGTEEFIWAIFGVANDSLNTVYGYTETYDEANDTYGFSFYLEEVTEYEGSFVQYFDVKVVVEDGTIKEAFVEAKRFSEGNYLLDKTNGICIVYPDAYAEPEYYYHIVQTIGERSNEENPYSYDKITLSELTFDVCTQGEDENWNTIYIPIDGIEFADGCTITIAPGYENGIYLVLPEDLAEYGDLNIFNVETFAEKGISNYPIMIYAIDEGTYPVTISNGKASVSFTIVAEFVPPTSLEAGLVNEYNNVTPSTSVEVYAGVPVTIAAIPNSNLCSPATNATVTAGDPDAVTLVESGNNWIVIPNEAGTYTITLTSKLAEGVSTSITVVANEPPQASDLLNGTYTFTEYGLVRVNVEVTFTPDSEGATSGTVVIKYTAESFFSNADFTETATYAYADGVITLTHVSGDGAEYFDIAINENYEVVLSYYESGKNDPSAWPQTCVLEKAEGAPDDGGDVTLDALAGEWTGTESSYGMTSNYIITVNANGTGSGSYDMGYGPTTFDITAITIEGTTVTFSTITTGDYGGTEQAIVFTYAAGALSTDSGLMYGPLTLTPAGGASSAAQVTGGVDFDSATLLELGDANYVTTIGAGEKAYFTFEHDYASMSAVYEITFVVTSGECTLYSVTYNMMGENAFPLPSNYCISTIDCMYEWKAVVAIENTTDAEVTYEIEVTCATVQA